MPQITRQQKLDDILAWQVAKPTTDDDWAEDVKTESLHVKYDYQIAEMKKSHEAKLPHVQKDLDKFNDWPAAVKFELNEQFSDPDFDLEGKTIQQRIDTEFAEQHTMYKWKVAKLEQSIERISKEKELRASGYLVTDKDDKKKPKDVSGIPENRVRKIKGTTYFIDSDNGNDANTGLGIGAGVAWATLDKFTEASRGAGDIAILRRGMTNRYDNGSDLLFTSDGVVENPITIEADFADAWSDDVDLSATATATLIFGSKTITFSSDISGVLAVGDFIYASGDDGKEFAYEVKTVATTTVTLFLPYKGAQAGSGKTMTNMQSPPIWNTAAGDFQVEIDLDLYWKIQGIHFRGTDSNGVIELDSCGGTVLKDVILEGNGIGDFGIKNTDDNATLSVLKCRIFNCETGIDESGTSGGIQGQVINTFIDGNSVSSSEGLSARHFSNLELIEVEFAGHLSSDIDFKQATNGFGRFIKCRNCIFSAGTEVNNHHKLIRGGVLSEDHNGVVGITKQIIGMAVVEGDVVLQSDVGTIRSGGSNTSIKITPTTAFSTNWEFARLKCFELPFYATTSSKTYTVYFKTGATGDWTADPTNTELWIELEYWGHASNNFRRITKSTEVIDMNGSSAWQTLTVTVAPPQAGVVYLRCYYSKTKESAKDNKFFIDPIPVVT